MPVTLENSTDGPEVRASRAAAIATTREALANGEVPDVLEDAVTALTDTSEALNDFDGEVIPAQWADLPVTVRHGDLSVLVDFTASIASQLGIHDSALELVVCEVHTAMNRAALSHLTDDEDV